MLQGTRGHLAIALLVSGTVVSCAGPNSTSDIAPAQASEAQPEYRTATTTIQEGPWTNRLIHATSPYLSMHAHDPVNWYAWGDEAFAEAKRRGVPVFLSIGYYACHWCHVMHHESFSDPEIAAYLNGHFVSIKVDREERPDVDAVYMDAIHLMGQNGGWPASLFLTPERVPFFAGTYFPPRARFGRPGFRELLERLSEAWQTQKADIEDVAARVREALVIRADPPVEASADAQREPATSAAAALVSSWNPTTRGFGRVRQFPMTANLDFLLDHGLVHQDRSAIEVVEGQLDAMDRGGIHDHLGGGFHRYTVDSTWTVPHFEKMLYDNGQLLRVYSDAAVVLDNPRFAAVARDIAEYLLREMRAKDGTFWSSQSADSEGEEGTFYVWTPDQIRRVLDDPAPFLAAYPVTDKGNFEGGRTVLTRTNGDPDEPGLAAARNSLFLDRSMREPPPTDTKRVVAWNGLAIGGLAHAGRLLGERRYVQAAVTAAGAILSHRRKDGGLPRTLAENAPDGVLEDYAFLAEGLLDLYEADPNPRWLVAADAIAVQMVQRFQDGEKGGFFQAGIKATDLLVRRKDPSDGAEPSGSGRALAVLARLRAYGAPAGQVDVIESGLTSAGGWLSRQPGGVPSTAQVADRMARTSREVIFAGSVDDVAPFLAEYNRQLRPRTVIGVVDWAYAETLAPFGAFTGKVAGEDGALAYLCYDGVCRQPVGDLATFVTQLAAPPPKTSK